MDKQKRNSLKVTGGLAAGLTMGLLPKHWAQPVIDQVLLPAHAQTSLCEADDIVGEWRFVEDLDQVFFIEFYSDGTGVNGSLQVRWFLDDQDVNFEVGSSETTRYSLVVTQPCTTMEGINSFNNDPVTGTKVE